MEISTDSDKLLSQCLKRKRDDDNDYYHSDMENAISNELTKLLTENSGPSSNKESSSNEKSTEKPLSRKRKFIFTTDGIPAKKCKKYLYLSKLTTKPRKLKAAVNSKIAKHNNEIEKNINGKLHKLHLAKVDENGSLYLMHRLYGKSNLFFDDEKKYNYEKFKRLDLAFHVVDEIALEGLDGITLEAFWKRLKHVFSNSINKIMADRIWRLICNNKRINFYILKEPREELVFYDRCKYLNIDSNMFVEPFIEFKDIYPLAFVNSTEVRGSCSTFNTRKENNGVRKFSMEKALKLYDQRLVFVADQILRNKALINEEADPNIELQDVEYCMLEKIGRCREQGEFTHGKISLVGDSKKIYHNRKVLSQHFLIVSQNFCLKPLGLSQNITGGLVQLSRFYHKRKTKQVAIMERIAHLLKSRPNNQIELNEFRKVFGRNVSLVKLLKTVEFKKFFKIYTYPFRKLYPNATKQEYLHKNKMKERQIKVLRIIDPYANVTALMEAKETKEISQEKIDNSPGHKSINYEYLRDIFHFILASGRCGVTVQEIHDYFKTDFYSVRMAVRKLLLRNVISSMKIDLGRQQSLKFFAKCFLMCTSHIETQPKDYQLTSETLERIFKPYEIKINIPCDLETPVPDPIAPTVQFKLNFDPFCCTSFLTETVNTSSEELTIYDIVVKGRDKLLLIESNLFAQYISEWDDFLLKKDDFSKGILLFQNGFGKVIYDFLTTVRISDKIQTDNIIIFDINNVSLETKIGRQFQTHRIINLKKNYRNPHSDYSYIDIISKIYVFDAMFNELTTNRLVEKLKNIFELFMLSENKRKRKKEEVKTEEVTTELEIPSNVLKEKFMGPNPTLEWCGREDDITIEIFASTKPDHFKKPGTLINESVDLTQRFVNRANLILSTVYEKKIVQDVKTLYKDIVKEEDEEGYDKKACKKTIISIITKLVTDGYIKCLKVVMSGKNLTKNQCFICVHDIDYNNDFIQSTIEQLKLKFYSSTVNVQKTFNALKKTESPFSSIKVKESITEMKQLTNAKGELNIKLDRTKGKTYGYAPKFVRMRELHELLFYLIREMTECAPLNNKQIVDLLKNSKVKMTPPDIAELPPIYQNEINWKMFIPPLPKHSTWPKGWALASDIVLRMPLSIFVKLHHIMYEVPDLELFLNHPVKKHYLVKHLPAKLRNILLYRRKYFHSIYDTICNLCYIGLMQLGPRNLKEKDQMFLYLNSKASLFDTCNSKPGYHQIEDKKYKKIPFEFKTSNDVDIFWSEMLRICMNTPLGKRKNLDGQIVTIEDCASKPAMVETLKAKTFDDVVVNDNGDIPGDGKGSAGFDSSLWSSIKRNWMWGKVDGKRKYQNLQEKKMHLLQPIDYNFKEENKPHGSLLKLALKKSSKKKKVVRKIVARRKKRVREYYDAIDRNIMKRNTGIKVDWSTEEDQLLRYCRVASAFLCPVFKKQFIPYNILRDVLHRIHPKSKNKTARAIQRRIYVMLTNDEVMKTMETNIENLLNSDTVSKYFEQIHNRYEAGIKVTDSQMYTLFAYLMSYICKHRKEVELLLLGCFASFDFFADNNINESEAILQNCDHGNNSIYRNPESIEDVTKDTIKSVIHCSMSCRKNTPGWTFYLSRIYKKFQDDLIRITAQELRKDQFFVYNKSSEDKTYDNLWPIPIKFSYAYNIMKTSSYTLDTYQKAFQNFLSILEGNTNPEAISFINFNELISFWDKVDFIFDIPEMGIILNPDIDDHTEVIEELAKRFHIYLNQIFEKNVVKTKTESVLQEDSNKSDENIEQIKDEVRHLIFRVPYLLEGNLEMFFKKMLDTDNLLEINNYIFLMIADLKKFAQNIKASEDLKSFVAEIHIENDNVNNQNKLLEYLSKVVFAIQNIHQCHDKKENTIDEAFKIWQKEIRIELNTKNDEESNNCHKNLFNKKYTSGMEEAIKRAQIGDFPTIEEIKEGMMEEVVDAETRKIPHITDLIMFLDVDKFPDLDIDIETVEKMKEHFIVQYPELEQFYIENIEDMKDSKTTKKIMDDTKLDVLRNKTENVTKVPELGLVVKYISEHNGSEVDVKITESLLDFIKSRKELGVSAKELKTTFADRLTLNLVKLLEFLTEVNIVLRVGVTSILYVHHEHQSEWLVETFTLDSNELEQLELGHNQEVNESLKATLGEKIQWLDIKKVQLKPWTRVDGSINNEKFHDWLCIILSRCIDFPNIPFLVLCEQFHYIKPVDIFLLLEILQVLGCVQILLLNYEKSSLFSDRCIISECEATCLDDFEEMFVKPTNVTSLCFGSFINKSF